MAHNLDLLFPGMEIEGCEQFRITRNANTVMEEEEADDLLALIETGLRERKFAPVVRMEVASGMDTHHRGRLAAEFGLDEEKDVTEVDGLLALRGCHGDRRSQVPHAPRCEAPPPWITRI